ncbi:retrovirus-related pol polyprotein from transposon TNT 1-94 [Tanacetum coccineum]
MLNTNTNLQTKTSNALHNAIMEAGGKDRPLMLAPGNYNPPYKFKWTKKTVPIAEGSSETTTKGYMKNYKNVSQDIRNQSDAKAEAVQIILTEINNDIYSTVDACPNACEIWKAIERLKQGESINVQDLETNLYWEFGKFTSRDGESLELYYSRFYKMMNELVRNQCDVTSHQVNVQFLLQLQPEWQKSQQAATKNRGKAIVNSPPLTYDQEPEMVAEDDALSKEKEVDKLMAMISLSFKKIYKPTNNNLRTSSNISRANKDNTPRINKCIRYDNQRVVKVAGARENVGIQVVQQSEIQCYNCKEYEHVARECQKLKWAKDAAYHKEKIQEVTPDAADNSGPIFNTEPLQKVQNDDDNYNVFANDKEHPEQPESVNDTYLEEQGDTNITIDSLDMSTNGETVDQDDDDLARERDLLASLIDKLKCEIDDSKNRNKLLKSSNKTLVDKLKDLKKFQAELDRQEIEKVIALENKVKVLDDIVYKTGQSVQTMNMLNRNCKMSFVKPEFLKKAQRANPRLYDIGCYNDNLALMLAPESDETIRLAQESRSKLSDLIKPFDYKNLNNLYDLFVPQREKSSEQRYFSKRSKMSHTPVKNENSKESFNKQTTLLEKRMDESILWDQKCKSSKELFKIKSSVDTIFDGVERCKQTIAKRTYFGHIDPFIQNTIEGNFCPQIRKINADLEKFHLCLKEEMVADLRYFNSLEHEVDSLKSQLETQKT